MAKAKRELCEIIFRMQENTETVLSYKFLVIAGRDKVWMLWVEIIGVVFFIFMRLHRLERFYICCSGSFKILAVIFAPACEFPTPAIVRPAVFVVGV